MNPLRVLLAEGLSLWRWLRNPQSAWWGPFPIPATDPPTPVDPDRCPFYVEDEDTGRCAYCDLTDDTHDERALAGRM